MRAESQIGAKPRGPNFSRKLDRLFMKGAIGGWFGQAQRSCPIRFSLLEPEYEAAKTEAKRLGISLAELLRRSLRTMLPADESKPWMRYAGMVESGDPNSSRNIDDVVYGQKPCGLCRHVRTDCVT